MSDDLAKKAVKLLLKGATLLGEPCPYCKGVRIMDGGNALCIGCGREPEKREIPKSAPEPDSIAKTLEAKLESLRVELEKETDHKKQQEILESINSLVDTMDKLKDRQ